MEAEAKLKELKANQVEPEEIIVEGNPSPLEYEQMPWKRARAMIPGLIGSQTWDSSVRHKSPSLSIILTTSTLVMCRHMYDKSVYTLKLGRRYTTLFHKKAADMTNLSGIMFLVHATKVEHARSTYQVS